jgi:hypothetical protein
MGDGHQLGARPDRVDHTLRIEIAIAVDVYPLQNGTLPFTQEVPRHDVRVMLHDGQHDLVARLEPRHRPRIGDHVDALGRARIHHDAALVRGVQELRNRAAHGFVFLGREVRQVMQPAMDVGIFLRIGAGHGIDDHLRLLRRCPVVEIDKRLAVYLPRQDRKIGTNLLYIKH